MYVRTRCEKSVASILDQKNLETFLPLQKARKRWSDRVKTTDTPLLPNYLFCRFDPGARIHVLTTSGVISVLGGPLGPIPVEQSEIESLRTLCREERELTPVAYIPPNHKVRIEHGPLTGVEGTVVCVRNHFRLVVSISLLHRSVLAEVDMDSVADLETTPTHGRSETKWAAPSLSLPNEA
ncbi:MAG: UpxY family transcription antiterminator [Acidobacteriota bacterium]|nr:UpxY family transcription antiterminator [Acidobacteriota bacterium]